MSNRKQKISGQSLFRESQQFRVKWLWFTLIFCVLVSIGVTAGTAYTDQASRKEVVVALALVLPLESALLYLFYIIRLETVVTTDGVFYRWWPLFKKFSFIGKKEIAATKPDKGPTLSYGYHYIPGYGNVHNTGPGKGIRFVLQSGKKIFIGTQKLNAFQAAVEEMVKNQ